MNKKLDRQFLFYKYLMLGYSIREITQITHWSKSTIHYDLQKLATSHPNTYGKYIIEQLNKNYKNRGIKSQKIMKERKQRN